MDTKSDNHGTEHLIHVHACTSCGRASRREERDGIPDAAGIYHCSFCGHEGPLNVQIIDDMDSRLQH